jgi:hypothetical protein
MWEELNVDSYTARIGVSELREKMRRSDVKLLAAVLF